MILYVTYLHVIDAILERQVNGRTFKPHLKTLVKQPIVHLSVSYRRNISQLSQLKMFLYQGQACS